MASDWAIAKPIPPQVHIEQVAADRRSYLPRENLQRPPLTRDLEIDYTALSFVVPQRVRFRYKLKGHDSGWQEPGTRRKAFYSDLRPGRYRFRVIACNNDGVWNDVGANVRRQHCACMVSDVLVPNSLRCVRRIHLMGYLPIACAPDFEGHRRPLR